MARDASSPRPHDPVVRLLWKDVEPREETLHALNGLAADTAYVGHSASLTRCRFVRDDGTADLRTVQPPKRWVYGGHVAELRDRYHWKDLRSALLTLPLPEPVQADLEELNRAKAQRVVAYTDLYGVDDEERPRGVVFIALLGLKGERQVEGGLPGSTEDDTVGSLPGFQLSLATHHQDVEDKAEAFSRAVGLSEPLVADIKLAGLLPDGGKADRRFQAWLHAGDPLGPEPDQVLAKSGRDLPRAARQASGLPERWKHEALSVRLGRSDPRLDGAHDPTA